MAALVLLPLLLQAGAAAPAPAPPATAPTPLDALKQIVSPFLGQKPAAAPAPAVPGEPAGAAPAKPAKPKEVAKVKRRRVPKPPPLVLFHVNRQETLSLQPDARLRFTSSAQHDFNKFMRCHHTGRRHVMSTRLLALLEQVSKHFDHRRILIVAGYRAPAAARNPKSPHKRGLAADFRIDGVPNPEVRDFCRTTFEKVGVGYYPNSSFVHLDVRKKESAFWIDYSGPNEAPLYSRTPDDDLKSGRADSFKPGRVGEGEGDLEAQGEAADPQNSDSGPPNPVTVGGTSPPNTGRATR